MVIMAMRHNLLGRVKTASLLLRLSSSSASQPPESIFSRGDARKAQRYVALKRLDQSEVSSSLALSGCCVVIRAGLASSHAFILQCRQPAAAQPCAPFEFSQVHEGAIGRNGRFGPLSESWEESPTLRLSSIWPACWLADWLDAAQALTHQPPAFASIMRSRHNHSLALQVQFCEESGAPLPQALLVFDEGTSTMLPSLQAACSTAAPSSQPEGDGPSQFRDYTLREY